MSKKDDIKYIDPNLIVSKFGLPDYPEKDEKLIELFLKANNKEIPVYVALIPMNIIKPFCEFKPRREALDNIREKYLQYVLDRDPQYLHIYQEDNHFIMSDDYYAYNIYLEADFEKAPCLIFGETTLQVEKQQIDWKM